MSSSDPPNNAMEDFALVSHSNAYSRKQKSLGLLCTKFLGIYNREGVESVSLDDAASRLGVERRRIYDIVNVIESVGVLVRKAKNRYSWIGFSGIPKALEALTKEAVEGTSGDSTLNAFAQPRFLEDEEECEVAEEGSASAARPSSSRGPLPKGNRSDNRREKSLGQLTQNFVKLFLTTDHQAETISLDDAAKFLLSDGVDPSQMRTKVRRLYDIANVLASLNLIEKTQHAESRKPAFRWLGYDAERPTTVMSDEVIAAKQCNKRAFGVDITNVDFKRRKMLSLAHEKPRSIPTRNDDIRQCNITAQRQLPASKNFIFGPFLPATESKCQAEVEGAGGHKVNEWEALASSFRLQYHNQALGDLFAHYMEAWNSWYVEVAQLGRSTTGLPDDHKTSRNIYAPSLTDTPSEV